VYSLISSSKGYELVDTEDITYDMGAAEGAYNHWDTQKSKLGLAFPNLPWYIDGDVKLTQSNAIIRHIGRKHNLFGKNVEEASEIDMLIDTSGDILAAIVKIIFDPDFVRLFFLNFSCICCDHFMSCPFFHPFAVFLLQDLLSNDYVLF
jgi:hypothetical protein